MRRSKSFGALCIGWCGGCVLQVVEWEEGIRVAMRVAKSIVAMSDKRCGKRKDVYVGRWGIFFVDFNFHSTFYWGIPLFLHPHKLSTQYTYTYTYTYIHTHTCSSCHSLSESCTTLNYEHVACVWPGMTRGIDGPGSGSEESPDEIISTLIAGPAKCEINWHLRQWRFRLKGVEFKVMVWFGEKGRKWKQESLRFDVYRVKSKIRCTSNCDKLRLSLWIFRLAASDLALLRQELCKRANKAHLAMTRLSYPQSRYHRSKSFAKSKKGCPNYLPV